MHAVRKMGDTETNRIGQGVHRSHADAEISAGLEARIHSRETPENEQGFQTFRWAEA